MQKPFFIQKYLVFFHVLVILSMSDLALATEKGDMAEPNESIRASVKPANTAEAMDILNLVDSLANSARWETIKDVPTSLLGLQLIPLDNSNSTNSRPVNKAAFRALFSPPGSFPNISALLDGNRFSVSLYMYDLNESKKSVQKYCITFDDLEVALKSKGWTGGLSNDHIIPMMRRYALSGDGDRRVSATPSKVVNEVNKDCIGAIQISRTITKGD